MQFALYANITLMETSFIASLYLNKFCNICEALQQNDGKGEKNERIWA